MKSLIITVLLLVVSIFGYSQKRILKKKISLRIENKQIGSVLDDISTKGNFFFSYNSEKENVWSVDYGFGKGIKKKKILCSC